MLSFLAMKRIPHLEDVILLDLDGVACDLLRGTHEALGAGFEPSAWKSYEIRDNFSKDQLKALRAVWHDLDFWKTLPARPGAPQAAQALATQYSIVIVTAPYVIKEHLSPHRRQWCRDVLGIEPDGFVQTKDKYLLPGRFLVDDCIENFHGWHYGQGILVDAPYNRRGAPSALKRVDGLPEFVRNLTTGEYDSKERKPKR